MPAIKHAILLTMSVLGAYLYLQVPFLKQYALQVFALVTIIYLVLQKRQRGQSYLILPENSSANLALINFAFLLLTGASGSLASPFFAITFIELFFLALAAPTKTALLGVLEIMVFHFSLSIATSNNFVLSVSEWSNLLALPLVMIFYIFAKDQYQKAYYNSLLVDAEERELNKAQSDDQAVADFIASLINKRLPMLEFLLSFPDKNKTAIAAEVKMLKRDLNILSRHISEKNQTDDDQKQKNDN
ncbi:MAG TPA: hypothetical protein PLQ50_00835 [Candidatus Woesebacteria bacterium]|nr:hypothetical protein [Candidatus Woesebacteria bacterium]